MAGCLKLSQSEGILQKFGMRQSLTRYKGWLGWGGGVEANASGQEQTVLSCSTKIHVLKAERRRAGQAGDKGANRHRGRSLPERGASKTPPGKPSAEKMRTFAKGLVSEVSNMSHRTLLPDTGAKPQRTPSSKKKPYCLGELTNG